MRWRRLRLGLSTVLGLKAQGFFIPYRYAASVVPSAYPALMPLFQAAVPSFSAVLAEIEVAAAGLERIARGETPARFDQDWFPRLDAAAAYALVQQARPCRIVEIGSGHSTRFMAQAIVDGGLSTTLVCIDPAPRANLDGLPVRHIPSLLRDADARLVAELAPGDMLFIDSSHIAMPGTDVDRLVLDVLPRLPDGILVHLHDILLPDQYPDEWTWRGYNEQMLVGALLQGQAYELVFASHFVVMHRPDLIGPGVVARLPLVTGAHETSLWLRKRSG
jgi:predicted O-methyltransferase YrrM